MEQSLFSRPFGPHYSLFQYDALLTVKVPRKQQCMAGLLIPSPKVCSIIKQCTHYAEEARHLFRWGVCLSCVRLHAFLPPFIHQPSNPCVSGICSNTTTSHVCVCVCVCRSVCCEPLAVEQPNRSALWVPFFLTKRFNLTNGCRYPIKGTHPKMTYIMHPPYNRWATHAYHSM